MHKNIIKELFLKEMNIILPNNSNVKITGKRFIQVSLRLLYMRKKIMFKRKINFGLSSVLSSNLFYEIKELQHDKNLKKDNNDIFKLFLVRVYRLFPLNSDIHELLNL